MTLPHWLPTIWKLVRQHALPRLNETLRDLVRNRPVAIGVAAALLVTAYFLGKNSFERIGFYDDLVEKSLERSGENTPQTYKALEALVLANADPNDSGANPTSFKKSVSDAKFSSEFVAAIEQIQKAFLQEPDPSSGKDIESRFVLVRPELSVNQPQQQQTAIITEVGSHLPGFLFLPARLLHIPPETYASILKLDEEQASAGASQLIASQIALAQDTRTPPPAPNIQKNAPNPKADAAAGGLKCPAGRPICDDVLTSRKLIFAMKAATNIAVTDDAVPAGIDLKPAQVYFITENGLNRIVSNRGNDDIFYRNQFRASTVFVSRPYYLEALKKQPAGPGQLVNERGPSTAESLSSYFYVSEPYLDIGGNGVVVTLSRALKYEGHSEGVISFDLRLTEKQALGERLETLITQLNSDHVRILCKTGSGNPTCSQDPRHPGSSDLFNIAQGPLEQKLREANRDISSSDVVGALAFLQQNTDAAEPENAHIGISRIFHPTKELIFSLPLAPPEVLNPDPKSPVVQMSFLAISLDVGHYLQNTAVYAGLALVCIGFAFTTVVLSAAAEARARREGEEKAEISDVHRRDLEEQKQKLHLALDNVSGVMMRANTPYVRLDNNDRIVDGNPKLAAFFGRPETAEAVREFLIGRRFKDMIADDDSRADYDAVQHLRASGQPVAPYPLNLRSAKGIVRATVVSSVVPASQDRPGSLPETFGILIEQA